MNNHLFISRPFFENTMILLGLSGKSSDTRYGYTFTTKASLPVILSQLSSYMKTKGFNSKVSKYPDDKYSVIFRSEDHSDYLIADISSNETLLSYYFE